MRDGGAGGGKDLDYSDCVYYLVFLEREKKVFYRIIFRKYSC